MAKAAKDIVAFQVRCPAALHAKLKKLAKAEKRSLHAQVLVIFEQAVKTKRAEGGGE